MRCTEGARKHLTPLIWRNKSPSGRRAWSSLSWTDGLGIPLNRQTDTSLFLDDPLGDFVHAAHLVTEVVHVLLHHSELLGPASEASD